MAKKREQWAGYWLDEKYTSLDLSDRGASAAEAIRLAGVKRAIANFVRIVTSKNIPVLYNSGADSYTEGTVVVISASTKQKTFDSVVGLALHEASHNLLSNFEFLRNFRTYSNYMIPVDILRKSQAQNFSAVQLLQFMRFVMNILEDRWIDYYMYRQAPGYRPYYEAMYDAYFRDKQIDYAMQTGKYRETTVDNYLFYITNMTNPWFDTRALPDLDLIYGLIDLPNVSRFDARTDSGYKYAKIQCDKNATHYDLDKMPLIFQLCARITEIVLENTDPLKKAKEPKKQPKMRGMQVKDESKEDNLDISKGVPQSGAGGKGSSVPMDDEDSDDESQDRSGGESQDSSDSDDTEEDSGGSSGNEPSDKQESGAGDGAENEKEGAGADAEGDESDAGRKKKHAADTPSKQGKVNDQKLKKAIEKQKDFLDGNVKKKKVSKSLNTKINAVEQAGATTVMVPHGLDYGGTTKTEVLVMRELTRSIMESGAFPFTPGASGRDYNSYRRRGRYSYSSRTDQETITLRKSSHSEQAVQDGLRAGAILAQRLQIRNQNQLTKYNRRPRGNLDKRRLAALGHEEESVFYKLKIAEFKPVHLHMTLDASGSMGGNPWKKALTVAVAVAVAAEKIENLELTISIRAAPSGTYATIAIIFDSRKDDVSKIKQLFPYLCTNGVTPEGLTFAAIMEDLLDVKADDKYFINLSDGMPWYEGYSGESAYRHTREQVNRLKGEGISVLSYFITEGYYTDSSARSGFNKMYGKDASFIDVQKLPSLVATLNKLFLQR